jgi:ribose/xylose/arabinose/galactoside ABC-type transport system permease subunit
MVSQAATQSIDCAIRKWNCCLTYVSCSVLAAIAALLLAAFSGGATLDMGADYMLLSVAVVVIGGTLVSGGRASREPGAPPVSSF